MQPGGEDGIVLPSFEDGGVWEPIEVLCLIALASCIDNGRTLKAIYWDIRSAVKAEAQVTEAQVTKAKTKSEIVIWKSPFK